MSMRPNEPASANAGWAPQLAFESHWLGEPEPGRSRHNHDDPH
jgi:hypothetical protein